MATTTLTVCETFDTLSAAMDDANTTSTATTIADLEQADRIDAEIGLTILSAVAREDVAPSPPFVGLPLSMMDVCNMAATSKHWHTRARQWFTRFSGTPLTAHQRITMQQVYKELMRRRIKGDLDGIGSSSQYVARCVGRTLQETHDALGISHLKFQLDHVLQVNLDNQNKAHEIIAQWCWPAGAREDRGEPSLMLLALPPPIPPHLGPLLLVTALVGMLWLLLQDQELQRA